MKITGFRPLIVTKDLESTVKVFEALGFERHHHRTGIENGENELFVMQDAEGNRVNVVSSEAVPRDFTAISINVDNFQEAYEFFLSQGFVNPRGEKVTDVPASKGTMVVAPSGVVVTINEHIKEASEE